MKAVTRHAYGPESVLEVRDVDRPVVRDDDVLVEVRAAALDPGVWIFMTGRPYAVRIASGVFRPRNPVLGLDVAGVVAAVGARVTRFRPGDEVYGTGRSGSFAELVTAKEKQLAAKPAALSFVEAAAVPVSGVTALQSVRRAGVRPGHRVMVTGAGGGVGSYAVQLAVAAGADVTGVCSGGKADLVRSLGAADVVDHTREEIDRDGPRYDVLVDLAGCRPLPVLRRAVRPRGTIALVGGGHARGRVMGGFQRLMAAPLISVFMSQRLVGVSSVVRAAELDELSGHIEAGRLRPVIGATYDLADAAEAMRDHAASRSPGKVVLTLS